MRLSVRFGPKNFASSDFQGVTTGREMDQMMTHSFDFCTPSLLSAFPGCYSPLIRKDNSAPAYSHRLRIRLCYH